MKIDARMYQDDDGDWWFEISPDFDVMDFNYPLTDTRYGDMEGTAWAMMATVNQLNFWFWQQNQLEIQF